MLGLASQGGELLLSRAMGNRVWCFHPGHQAQGTSEGFGEEVVVLCACSMACSPAPFLAIRAGSYWSGSLAPRPDPRS